MNKDPILVGAVAGGILGCLYNVVDIFRGEELDRAIGSILGFVIVSGLIGFIVKRLKAPKDEE